MSDVTNYDAGDHKSVQRFKSKEELIRQTELEDLRKLTETKPGRFFIYRIMEMCGVFQSGVGKESLRMAEGEGARKVGLDLRDELLEVDPKLYGQIIAEGEHRRSENAKGRVA